MKKKTDHRETFKLLVRARQDIQASRIANDGRLGVKADGKPMAIDKRTMDSTARIVLQAASNQYRATEAAIDKEIKIALADIAIYVKWFASIRGVGPAIAAGIIAHVDIVEASTVSKLWQYCGVSPGLVFGQKVIAKASFKPAMGTKISEFKAKAGGMKIKYRTTDKIRGDKKLKGYCCPFNSELKVLLCGILADSLMKQKSPYKLEHYDTRKLRLEQSDTLTNETKLGGKVVQVKWKDATKQHRSDAARRHMIKIFLQDLYKAWRGLEGLTIRPPYQEEYLGHVHNKEDVA